MNQKLFFFSLLALFFLYSFYEGDKDSQKSDHKNVSAKTIEKENAGRAQQFEAPINSASGKIDADSVLKMIDCYKKHPLLKNPGTSTTTEYFSLDAQDWDYLIALHNSKPIKSLLFKFGIKNYDQVTNSGAAPIYTIITMPIDKATGVSSPAQAFDYICPCPGSACCPKE